jgi:probable HAF family extracellular repeat protein
MLGTAPHPRRAQRSGTLAASAILSLTAAAAAQPSSFRGIGHAPGHTGAQNVVISADGRFAAGTMFEGLIRKAFRWSDASGFEILQPGPGWGVPPSSLDWVVSGISADGSVIVGSAGNITGQAYTTRGFRWTSNSGMVDLGALPNSTGGSVASAISGDGEIIVGFAIGHAPEHLRIAFRWTAAAGMHEFLPGPTSFISTTTAI